MTYIVRRDDVYHSRPGVCGSLAQARTATRRRRARGLGARGRMALQLKRRRSSSPWIKVAAARRAALSGWRRVDKNQMDSNIRLQQMEPSVLTSCRRIRRCSKEVGAAHGRGCCSWVHALDLRAELSSSPSVIDRQSSITPRKRG